MTVGPVLVILSGLPGVGKSAIARELAPEIGAVYLRIDTIEQAIRNAGVAFVVGDEGYRVAYALAGDNLLLGANVVADSVNPLAITRDAWHGVAEMAGAGYLDVEVVCSDPAVHRKRVETRPPEIAGLKLPSWQNVLDREYDAWDTERLVVDTAISTARQCVERIREALEG